MLNAALIIIPALIIAGIIILFATILSKTFSGSKEGEMEYIAVAAASDKAMKVDLPDGTVVWLRASSSMKYNKDFLESRVVLVEGEANFNVTKYNNMSFVVKTEEVSVSVLGTQFNVRYYPESAESSVALIEGSVEVNMPSGNVILEPSEQITYNNQTGESKLEVIDVNKLNFWIEDDLVIDERSLSEAILLISEYYQLVLQHSVALPATKISINISRKDELRDVLDVLELLEPSVGYIIEGEIVKVVGK